MINTTIKTGSLLLAEPLSTDDFFKRAAVLVSEHRPDGTVGFILNQPTDFKVSDVVEDFPSDDFDLFFGGPVRQDMLHFLHNAGELVPDAQLVLPGVWWGGNFETIKSLIARQILTPKDIHFLMGYSGWSEGQLDEEIEDTAWIVADMDKNYLFGRKKNKDVWTKALENKGGHFKVLSQIKFEDEELLN